MGPIFSLLLFIFTFSSAHAFESLSYSGRLVNSDGSPVPGTANLTFDLAYSGSPGIIRCSQALNGVDLSHGVFHVKLNFPGCSPDILTIFSETPSGETVSIRVTDRTPDPDKIYSFQAVHSVPYAFIAKQLPKMNASDGQVLTWDDNAKIWSPRTPVAPSGGTITSVVGDQGLISTTTSGNVTIGILDDGVTSTKILDGTIVDVDISATAEIAQSKIKNLTTDLAAKESLIGPGSSTDYLNGTKAWNNFDQSVRNALLIGYTSGAATPVAATDNVMEAIGKLEGQIIANDTAFDNAGQWDKDGALLFYNSGNVGVGTATPSDKLEVVGDISVSNKLRFKNSAISYVELRAPVGAGAVTLTLPGTLGINGQVLSTDSSGNLSWLTPSTDSSQITDGSIVDADVSGSANIAQSKIAGLTTDLGSKEPTLAAGTSAQYYRGDKTWQTLNTDAVPEGTKLYFTEPKVLGTDLLGFSSGAGIISATDTVLSSIGKLDGNIAAVSSAQANYVLKAGDTMSGPLAMGSNKITGLADPTVATDAANKNYVDTQVSGVTVTPGGADEDIQFNNAGALGGVAKFKYSSANNSVFLGDKPSGWSNNYIYMNAGTSERSGVQMFTNTSGTAFADGFDIAAVFGYAEINLKEAGYLMLKTADLERMRITATGNVGINTETPGEKLDVAGNIALSGKLRLKSDTVNYIELKAPLSLATTRTFTLPNAYGTSGNALITDGAGNLTWGAVATTASSVGGDLTGTIGSAEIVSGAVGSAEIADLSIVDGDIANATITYGKLNLVDGDVPQAKVNGLVTALSGKEPTITNPNDTTKYWRGDKTWQTLNTSVVTEATNLYFTEDRVRATQLDGYLVGANSPVIFTDTLLGAVGKLQAQISSNKTAFDAQWTKTGNNLYYNSGNIGIGTSSPGSKLQIVQSTSTGTVTDNVEVTAISTNRNATFVADGAAGNGAGIVFRENNVEKSRIHQFFSDQTLRFINGGIEAMVISSDGKVGLGIKPAETSFHVNSTIPSTTVHPSRAGILVEAEGSSPGGRLGARTYSTTENPMLIAYRARGTKSAPTPLMSGDTILSLIPGGFDGSSWINGNSNAESMSMRTTQDWSSTARGYAINFSTVENNTVGGITRMKIDHNGNVGIGTTAPVEKLDVQGNVKIGNSGDNTCNASKEGSMRYNSTSKLMEFCNGTTWNQFAKSSDIPKITSAQIATGTVACGTYLTPMTFTGNAGQKVEITATQQGRPTVTVDGGHFYNQLFLNGVLVDSGGTFTHTTWRGQVVTNYSGTLATSGTHTVKVYLDCGNGTTHISDPAAEWPNGGLHYRVIVH